LRKIFLGHSRFITSIAPKDDLVGKAAAALIQNLGWNSFLLTYQDSQGLLMAFVRLLYIFWLLTSFSVI
jgi:hypothetical protein